MLSIELYALPQSHGCQGWEKTQVSRCQSQSRQCQARGSSQPPACEKRKILAIWPIWLLRKQLFAGLWHHLVAAIEQSEQPGVKRKAACLGPHEKLWFWGGYKLQTRKFLAQILPPSTTQ